MRKEGLLTVTNDNAQLNGSVVAIVRGPDGEIKQRVENCNIITQIGDQLYGERGAGIGSPPALPVGMKLGTGTTAVAKTGAGAALVTYKTGSNIVIDGSFPTSSIPGTVRRIQYRGTWAATVATDAALAEAVIFNDANANATSTAAFTISRVLLSPVVNKGAADSLEITWSHDIGT